MHIETLDVLTAGKYYLTSLKNVSGDDAVLTGPSGVETVIASGTSLQTLEKASEAHLKLEVASAESAVLDDLVAREWTGRHAPALSTFEPTVVSDRVRLQSKTLRKDDLVAADFTGYSAWALFLVVKRISATFAGDAAIVSFSSSSGDDHQLRVMTRSNGTIFADGRVSGGSYSGRATASGAIANGASKIIAVASVAGQGWRIYVNGARLDTADVGTGEGVSFSQFTSWAPRLTLGGHAGSPDLARFTFRGGLSYRSDETAILREITKLNYEYSIYESA